MAAKKKPAVHVVPHEAGWAVERDGNKRVSSTHRTQKEAEDTGRSVARREHTEFNLHDRAGRIRVKDSYGNDPNPPRDKD